MRKILNILVTFIFLLSFVGVQVNKHYSQGELYSVAVYQEAESCCGTSLSCDMVAMEESQCNHHDEQSNSCENIIELFKIDKVFVSEEHSIPEATALDLLILPLNVETSLYSSSIKKTISYYLPPPLEKRVQEEFAVFLC